MTVVERRTRHGRRAILSGLAGVTVAAATALFIVNPTGASAADPVGLGTAANFSALAGSTITNTGSSLLGQNLGVHPGTAVTGFPPGIVVGDIHLGDAEALQAENDLATAYDDAAGRTPATSLAAELGGQTLTPGVYRVGAAQVTGQLTLDAQNDPQAIFIFQIASTLVTASDSSVALVNAASACNVYWQVGSSTTLGTGTDFVGTIMAQVSITMTIGATLQGRALARSGAVTLDANVIPEPVCVAASPSTGTSATATSSPSVTPSPSPSPTATPTASPTATPTASVGPTHSPKPYGGQ